MSARILVIEDAEELRNDILEMLSFEGYEVFGAEDGQVGVDQARALQPDLIICDIMMPHKDGYQVLEELKEDGAGITTPFIFLTALSDRVDMRIGMDAGADDYLPKPFALEDLLSCVQRRLQISVTRKAKTEEELNQLRDNIILALPHELRTPLTGILGFSDILAMDSDVLTPEKIAEMSRYINAAAQRLYRLTENYVVFAQLEVLRTDQSRVRAMRQFVTEHPRSLIENVAFQKAQQYRREADIQVDLEDEAAIHIVDDNLKKVVEEVIDNAFKFSQAETPVDVIGKLMGDQYVLTVRDLGRGMKPDEIKRIGAFMQFGRRFFEQQGSGFGLAIALRSVELYGGRLEIRSEPGSHTDVVISLPAAPLAIQQRTPSLI